MEDVASKSEQDRRERIGFAVVGKPRETYCRQGAFGIGIRAGRDAPDALELAQGTDGLFAVQLRGMNPKWFDRLTQCITRQAEGHRYRRMGRYSRVIISNKRET